MSKISFFNKQFGSKGMPHFSDGELEIEEFVLGVKFGKWKDATLKIRAIENKEERDKQKRNSPQVTISGTFAERAETNLIHHSGFICIDLDGVTDKSQLINDPYLYCVFYSSSGKGLAGIFKINPAKHKESFNWLRMYLYNTYGLAADPAPQNVASTRCISYDPDLSHNPNCAISKFINEKPPKIKNLPVVVSDQDFADIIGQCIQRGINLTESYEEFRDIAFALANGKGEDGRYYFHQLAGISTKYNSRAADRQYDIALKDKSAKKITIGTLYHYIKAAGIEVKSQNKQAVAIASMAKKSNRSKEGVTASIVQLTGASQATAEQLVEEVFKRSDINIESVSKDPEKLIENICTFIAQNYHLKKNSITGIVENSGNPLTKESFNTMYLRIRSVFNSTSVSFDLIERIVLSEFTPTFDPIKEYIEKHRHLKGDGNINKLIATIETTTPNAHVFIRRWCIAWGAALDGFPVRSVLALLGGQHSGKTEWFRRLLPGPLKKYYAQSRLDAGKDDHILMCQKLIILDDELGGKSKKDEKVFKELTSRDWFSLRVPYGRYNEDFKRLAILCGTSNTTDIMSDPTGNTRYLPVEVISINKDLYNSIDKDELFMEIIRAYESGEEWQLSKNEMDDLMSTSAAFEEIPFERELINTHFENTGYGTAINLSATEIKDYIELHSKQKITNMKRFGVELKKVFGKSKPVKINGQPSYKYQVFTKMKEQNLQSAVNNIQNDEFA
jgi:predicted P-loop ATPase